MQITLGQTATSAQRILSRSARSPGFNILLGGVLFIFAFFTALPAFGTNDPAGQSVTLAWDASPDPTVVGYDVYYGVASGTYTNMINVGDVTSATIGGLVIGVTYYFAATTYDASGSESGYSGEISYTVPAPPVPLQIRSAPGGQFTLTVTGLTGQTYQILATQDLTTWTVIGTVTLAADGPLDFTDTDAANYSQRFYRTQEIF
jgi:hypothetical protein